MPRLSRSLALLALTGVFSAGCDSDAPPRSRPLPSSPTLLASWELASETETTYVRPSADATVFDATQPVGGALAVTGAAQGMLRYLTLTTPRYYGGAPPDTTYRIDARVAPEQPMLFQIDRYYRGLGYRFQVTADGSGAWQASSSGSAHRLDMRAQTLRVDVSFAEPQRGDVRVAGTIRLGNRVLPAGVASTLSARAVTQQDRFFYVFDDATTGRRRLVGRTDGLVLSTPFAYSRQGDSLAVTFLGKTVPYRFAYTATELVMETDESVCNDACYNAVQRALLVPDSGTKVFVRRRLTFTRS